jgi:RNA polymerase sigma-70 factor (ECF subfamily)
MDEPAERQMLERARAGDTAALTALIERHQAQVYRFGMRMCRDVEDAKDVLQDTLLTLARGIRSFRGESSFSTWLYAVARSFCIKKRTRKLDPAAKSAASHTPDEALNVSDPGRAPDEELSSKQIERAVEQAVDALDPKYRDVLILRDVEGLTAPEVAAVLGLGVPAVKSRLHRARLSVRERVAPVLGIGTEASDSSCPDVLAMFSRHLEDEISADVCAQMERHLDSCARCRSACDSLRSTLALCRSAGAALEVPDSVQSSVKRELEKLLAGEPEAPLLTR